MYVAVNTDAFKDSLLKCFIEVGLAEQEDETFVKFSYNKKGYLSKLIPQVKNLEEAVSVGEIVSELALTNRPRDAEDNSDAESGSEDEAGESGDGDSASSDADGAL